MTWRSPWCRLSPLKKLVGSIMYAPRQIYLQPAERQKKQLLQYIIGAILTIGRVIAEANYFPNRAHRRRVISTSKISYVSLASCCGNECARSLVRNEFMSQIIMKRAGVAFSVLNERSRVIHTHLGKRLRSRAQIFRAGSGERLPVLRSASPWGWRFIAWNTRRARSHLWKERTRKKQATIIGAFKLKF